MAKSGERGFWWIAAGTAGLIAVAFLVQHYHREGNAATRATSRAERMELVQRLSAGLSASSAAEKSAVMATTDHESQAFADQARDTMTAVEAARDTLERLLEREGTPEEQELLDQFSQFLGECRTIDRELLDLAVRNTNLKAYALAFGPASDELERVDSALSGVLKSNGDSDVPEAKQVLLLAAKAQSGAWRIQALLAPHISEETTARMDELETRIAREDREVRSGLKDLAALLGPRNSAVASAAENYARYSELSTQILALSRENTNVRSLFISLNQKTKAVQACQVALAALGEAIGEESLAERRPVNPR